MTRIAAILSCALAAVGCQGAGDAPAATAAPPKPEPYVWRHTLPTNPIPAALSRHDRNHDGYFDLIEKQAIAAELDEQRRWQREELLARYDVNHDGKIEGPEQDGLKRDLDQARAQAHAIALRKYDLNRDGTLDAEEKAAMLRDNQAFLARMQAQALARYDTNGNGVLDLDERAAIRASAHQLWKPVSRSPGQQP